MKKLLKSEICGSCEQCTGPTDVLKMAKSQTECLLNACSSDIVRNSKGFES